MKLHEGMGYTRQMLVLTNQLTCFRAFFFSLVMIEGFHESLWIPGMRSTNCSRMSWGWSYQSLHATSIDIHDAVWLLNLAVKNEFVYVLCLQLQLPGGLDSWEPPSQPCLPKGTHCFSHALTYNKNKNSHMDSKNKNSNNNDNHSKVIMARIPTFSPSF